MRHLIESESGLSWRVRALFYEALFEINNDTPEGFSASRPGALADVHDQYYDALCNSCRNELAQLMLVDLMRSGIGFGDYPMPIWEDNYPPLEDWSPEEMPMVRIYVGHEIRGWSVDFSIVMERKTAVFGDIVPTLMIAIDCDGDCGAGELQERIEFNIRKDRELQALGYKVLHFSEREISDDMSLCIEQIQGQAASWFDCLVAKIERMDAAKR